jgi:hypothetical protein
MAKGLLDASWAQSIHLGKLFTETTIRLVEESVLYKTVPSTSVHLHPITPQVITEHPALPGTLRRVHRRRPDLGLKTGRLMEGALNGVQRAGLAYTGLWH